MNFRLEDQDGTLLIGFGPPPEVTEHVVSQALAEARQRGEDDQIAARAIDVAEQAVGARRRPRCLLRALLARRRRRALTERLR